MTANEIKNAWNTFKKEIAKEMTFGMTGTCYMNAKQIKNGTATIGLCIDKEYDDEIAWYLNSIERVNAYTTWTDEEKKNSEASSREIIKCYENKKVTYGTPANEAQIKSEAILNSKAFKKLAATIGIHNTELELASIGGGINDYKLRIHY